MRYYSFNEFDSESGWVSTVSEEEIRRDYFPYWQKKMIDKFGEEYCKYNYSFEECLIDWMYIHHAWEVDDEQPED